MFNALQLYKIKQITHDLLCLSHSYRQSDQTDTNTCTSCVFTEPRLKEQN